MNKAINLTGSRFGRLLVQHRTGTAKNGAALWRCVCDCGGTSETQSIALRSGRTRSCGCLVAEFKALKLRPARTHGHTSGGISPTYNSWCAMRKRCQNEGANNYDIYGGRGIKVCDRWQKFENFLADMGERPTAKTLDRYPNKDGNYEPSNCRWATWIEQAQNRQPKSRTKWDIRRDWNARQWSTLSDGTKFRVKHIPVKPKRTRKVQERADLN